MCCVAADVQSYVPRYFADIKAEVDPSKTFRFYLLSGEISFHPLAVVAAVDLQRAYSEFCGRHKLRVETWDKTMVKDAFAHVQMKKTGTFLRPHDGRGESVNGVQVFKGLDFAERVHRQFLAVQGEGAGDPTLLTPMLQQTLGQQQPPTSLARLQQGGESICTTCCRFDSCSMSPSSPLCPSESISTISSSSELVSPVPVQRYTNDANM